MKKSIAFALSALMSASLLAAPAPENHQHRTPERQAQGGRHAQKAHAAPKKVRKEAERKAVQPKAKKKPAVQK